MTKTALLVCFLLLATALHAQVKTQVNATGRHRQILDHVQKGKKYQNNLKQFQGDSIAIINADTSLTAKEKRLAKKAYRKRQKLIRKELKRRGKQLADQQVNDQLNEHLPPEISWPPETPEDSLKWALQVLAKEEQYAEILEIRDQYQQYDSLTLDSLGYMAGSELAELAESYVPEEVRSELDASDVIPINEVMKSQLPDIPEEGLPHMELGELLDQIPAPALDEAVKKGEKLKSKYSRLPDLRNKEDGVKKTSLNESGFKNRIYTGGNASIKSTDPLMFDVDIQLGYRINKKWIAGVGIRWRETFKQDTLHVSIPESLHGYSVFTSYELIAHFFGYGEYAAVITGPLFQEGTVPQSPWKYQYLLGIGREFNLFKSTKLTTTLLYDFNHQNNQLNKRPFSIKIGYRINGFGMKKK